MMKCDKKSKKIGMFFHPDLNSGYENNHCAGNLISTVEICTVKSVHIN